jgi:hypothetical protein
LGVVVHAAEFLGELVDHVGEDSEPGVGEDDVLTTDVLGSSVARTVVVLLEVDPVDLRGCRDAG